VERIQLDSSLVPDEGECFAVFESSGSKDATGDGENPFDGVDAASVVATTLKRAENLLAGGRYDVLGAEQVLAQAIASLEARSEASARAAASPSSERTTAADAASSASDVGGGLDMTAEEPGSGQPGSGPPGDADTDRGAPASQATTAATSDEAEQADADRAHVARVLSSPTFREVSDRVAQFDASVSSLYTQGFKTLFDSASGKFEMRAAPNRRWFEYRMTVDIDAPLTECLSTGHEVDLLPQAQPLVSQSVMLGKPFGFNFTSMMRLGFPLIQPEVLIEVVRHRDHKFGYLIEVVRSEFASDDVPPKGWGVVRPWVFHTNLWIPRGGGKVGTTIVQVSRVDCTMAVPSWFLNVLLTKMSSAFIQDLRSSALKAMQPSSPWAQRIKEDKDGFYKELRSVETLAASRREVRVDSVPGVDIFNRPWRLRPPELDTRPPSSRTAQG